ncbi:MAG: CPBP family intramembrane metalloprotease [Chloroflexi bacterium]|nr:CPBP family intramembrane metalloprotease [Chloroflexota bacterium]
MAETAPNVVKRNLTIRGANVVLLVALVLFVTLGLYLQDISLMWGTVGTEFLAILLPVLVYLLIARLPLRETLRLRWPGWKALLFTGILGVGLMLLAASWSTLVSQWLKYDLPVPPEFYPSNTGEALLFMASLAIVAPLCEETLFRGLLQHAHERNGALKAIVLTAVIFSGFHLSLLRFVVLLPVALVLGYVAWRSRSLVVSFTLHAVYNGLSGILSLVGTFRPDLTLGEESASVLTPFLLAAALMALGLWGLIRASGPKPAALERDTKPFFKRSWPLIPVALVVVIALAAELFVGTQPQLLATDQLTLAGKPAEGSWSYAVYDGQGQVIGQAQTQVSQQQSGWQIASTQAITATAATGAGVLPLDLDSMLGWHDDTFYVQEGELSLSTPSRTDTYYLHSTDGNLRMTENDTSDGITTTIVSAGTFIPGEWPWRLTALEFSELAAWRVDLVTLQADGSTVISADSATERPILQVQGAEPLAVPAGNYIAWKVTLGDQTAWYDADAPHTLLRYDDGTHSLRLAKP